MPDSSTTPTKTPREEALDLVKDNQFDAIEPEFRNDPDFIHECLTKYAYVWDKVTEAERKIKRNMIAGVSHDGHRLFPYMDLYSDDKEVVTAAVKNNGGALTYASDRLKDDIEVVKACMGELWEGAVFASKRLKSTKSEALELVKTNGNFLKYCSKELKKDKEVCDAAVNQTGAALFHVDPSVKNADRDINIRAVTSYPICVGAVGTPFKEDPEIMYLAKRNSTTEAIDAANVPFRIERLLG